MSTIYNFNEKDAFESIEIHYFNDGWDVAGMIDGGNVHIYFPTFGRASDVSVENVEDVFIGEEFAFVVEKTECANDSIDLQIFKMTKDIFMEKLSEQVWAKFRADRNDTICPECGKRMAHSVSSSCAFGEQINQFNCEECHYTWVGFPNGKFIREGILLSKWDIMQGREWE